jgi:hypothetical protein
LPFPYAMRKPRAQRHLQFNRKSERRAGQLASPPGLQSIGKGHKSARRRQGPAPQAGGQVTMREVTARSGRPKAVVGAYSCLLEPARDLALVAVSRSSPQHFKYDGSRPTEQEHAVGNCNEEA